jgi:hypothetical protein
LNCGGIAGRSGSSELGVITKPKTYSPRCGSGQSGGVQVFEDAYEHLSQLAAILPITEKLYLRSVA